MKKFKTESKRMLDLMINSIYTNREIFLRELLSNASDATDKLYFKSLNGGVSGLVRDDLAITIDVDEKNRTLKITDKGIGMTADELENNLGTIAKSGSLDFKTQNEVGDDVDIIGQFGVGFYSAFMVAKKVEVVSKAYGSDEANKWVSEGCEGYEITPCEKAENGTEITLYLKDDTEEEKFDEFLQEYKIKQLVKKYSDFVKYPIKMLVTNYKQEGEGEDAKTVTEKVMDTVNSMVPLWKKQKSEVTDQEYQDFYKQKFYGYDGARKVITISAEGVVSYKALLFIPNEQPYNFYTKNYEKGLMLYTNNVLITEKCADLLPDYFGFVKGVVDSELTLNISRETVQQNRQLKAISQSIEKKIKSELINLQKNERESYCKFFDSFGLSLKYGIYQGFGANNEVLQDLIMFKSARSGEYVTLQEYVDNMADEQKYIIYATGQSLDAIKVMPQVQTLIESGKDVLCFTDEVDEFAIKMLAKFADKEFKSIESGAYDEQSETPVDSRIAELALKELEGKIVKIKGSENLKEYPCSLLSEGEISIEMEKVFDAMPDKNQGAKAKKVLQLNVKHDIYQKLIASDDETAKKILNVLYQQARLIAGLKVDDALSFSNDICSLIK